MTDRFTSLKPMLGDPPDTAFSITANDNFNSAFTTATRKLYVGQSGNVRCRFISAQVVSNGAYAPANTNNIVTLFNVPVGFHEMRIDMVFATGTTANLMVGMY